MIFATPLGLLALLAIPASSRFICSAGAFPCGRSPGCSCGRCVRQTPEGGGKITRLPITPV